MKFGDRLLKLRKQKNMSQETLADKIGITRQTVSNWEMNITVPNIDDLKKIANTLNVSYDELLDETKIKRDEKTNDINDNATIILKIFKIIGIIFILGIIATLILIVIFKENYDKTNVIGENSIKCLYGESIYTYNIDYNKKHKIVNVEITGQQSEKDLDIKWIDELGRYVTSKEITEPNTLISYIEQKYKENHGYCN